LLKTSSISAYPSLNFIIVINPSSGPGTAPWWPNIDYIREIPRLKAYANVRLVAYVHATYCKRPIGDVFNDIAKYATWSHDESCPGLGVEGVFVDETLNLHSVEAKQYLDSIDEKVKATDGVEGDRIVCSLSPLV
jgi:hypothetical protein